MRDGGGLGGVLLISIVGRKVCRLDFSAMASILRGFRLLVSYRPLARLNNYLIWLWFWPRPRHRTNYLATAIDERSSVTGRTGLPKQGAARGALRAARVAKRHAS